MSYYLPRYSIKAEEYRGAWGYFAGRGIREKTVAGHDEDEITMGLEAVAHFPSLEGVGYVATAASAGPRMSTTVVAALRLDSARKSEFGGSTNASGEALLSCWDFVEANGGRALLVTAQAPHRPAGEPEEHRLGAAAVAILLSPEGGLKLVRAGARTREDLGGSSDGLNPEAVRETLASFLQGQQVDWAVAPEPDGRTAPTTLKGLVDPSHAGGGVVELTGDTGCVSPFLSLAQLVGQVGKGEQTLLVTHGGGALAMALLKSESAMQVLRPPKDALASGRVYLDYMRYAQFRRFLSSSQPSYEVSMGAYLSLPSYLDTIQQRYRLVGKRCLECQHLHFPPRPACMECGSRSFKEEVLSGDGTIYARTVIGRGSAPTEFREQQDLVGEYGVCIVELKEGPRLIAQLTDCDPNDVDIGMEVEFVLRRIYRQEGVVRYGYKFRPRSEVP